jgi:hypothetical protein
LIGPDMAQELAQELAEKVIEPALGQLAKQPVQVQEDSDDRDDGTGRTVQNIVTQQQYYEPDQDRSEDRDFDRDR